MAGVGHELADRFARWRRAPATGAAEPRRRRRRRAAAAGRGQVAPVVGAALQVERPHRALRRRRRGQRRVARRATRGTIVGLIGPNGAGKTSVIDAVTGFAPATGTVELAGRRLDGLAPHARVRRRPRPDLPVARALRRPVGRGERQRGGPRRPPAPTARRPSTRALDRRRDRRRCATARPASSARASASSCRSPGPASPSPRCCCSTSRPPASTPSESTWLGERIRDIARRGHRRAARRPRRRARARRVRPRLRARLRRGHRRGHARRDPGRPRPSPTAYLGAMHDDDGRLTRMTRGGSRAAGLTGGHGLDRRVPRPRPRRRRRAACSRCSARTGPARRRCCSRSPGCCPRTAGTVRSTAPRCAPAARRRPTGPASCSSPTTGACSPR